MINHIKEFTNFTAHILENKNLVVNLIKNDFKKQYLGSYLGLFWAFVQPLTFIFVIWFVFDIGFRTAPVRGDTPFFLWLISGMIPWFFFAEGFNRATNAIVDNDFLVKKVSFRISILPLVAIGSELVVHTILVLLLIVAFLSYSYFPSIYWLQLFYYIFSSVVLLLGLSWLTSSIRVFVKDISAFISVIIQIGFWATPIFWQLSMVPHKYQFLFKLNPMYYIISGFRDTFINHIWFWEKPYETLYFLIISSIIFIIGALVFRRLRPHFGDVL
jgi:lipopolysaccharide transport system permease protein/teichoic acid transport system permease protein